MIELIKAALWGTDSKGLEITREAYDDMNSHAVLLLLAGTLSDFKMSPEIRSECDRVMLQQVSFYCHYKYAQDHLPIDVPYVILKGTSAALYYPHPEFRTMGDIDIMTRHEDYTAACEMLLRNGYKEVTSANVSERARHREFEKNGINIEVHLFFASMNDADKAKEFDDLIIENINSSHILPDLINGLVLLEHINQHLEQGLGLRQILDWMMFVDNCLSDEKWLEFQNYVKRIGLEVLAIVTTRMCEIYLGLAEHTWCSNADENICKQLMKYVLDCGNFGNKINNDDIIAVSRFSKIKHPVKLIKALQKRGLQNWNRAEVFFLRPFAWLHELLHYRKKDLLWHRGNLDAKDRDKMLDTLGVVREARGLVSYRNGKYL